MDEQQIKDIIAEIDDLVTKVTESGDEPSQEVIDGLDEIAQAVSLLKEKKQVDNSKELISKLDNLIKVTSDSNSLTDERAKSLIESIKQIKIDVPQVNVAPPEVNVNVPEIKVPSVNVPQTVIPEPKVYFPDEMSIKKPSWIENLVDVTVVLKGLKAIYDTIRAWKLPIDPKDAIPVRLSNGEKFYNALGGMASAIVGAFPFKKADSSDQAALVREDGTQVVEVSNLSDLTIDADQINLNTDTLEAKLQTIIDQTAIGTPTHFSGIVGATPVDTITPASATKSILIENTHATQNVLISLDSGSNWKTVRPYGVFTIDCSIASFQVKGSGASTTYEGIYVL